MEEAEQILKLFDSFWFERSMFTSKDRNFAAENTHEKAAADDDHVRDSIKYAATNLQYTRSFSDHYLGHKAIDRLIEGSPRSPIKPHIHKILSGGEIDEFFELVAQQERAESEGKQRKKKKKKRYMGKSLRRSISALEFEEVKGFVDLGFVFTEEDKDSGLVSIIPGLSEAWKNLYSSNEGCCNNSSSSMNWRIPYVHNENKMKNNLRAWAHTVVASAVR